MKTAGFLSLFITASFTATLPAQIINSTNVVVDAANTNAPPPPPSFPADYTVTARSEQTRTWGATTYVTNAAGRIRATHHRVTELQNGVAFRDPVTGLYSDSSDQLAIQPGGGAIATRGPSQLYVPGDLYTDAIQCQMSDGQTIATRPIGLALSDGVNTVLISQLRAGPTGQLLQSGSSAIYTNICTGGPRCDLLVENKSAGYEASLIIREQFNPAVHCKASVSPNY